MAEYTYKDIIIDPTSEEAKNAVGKICYFSDSPTMLLKMANSNDDARTLESIDESDYPFNDKEFGSEWTCIIVKKEEPYSERAKRWIEENNLKEGDYIKVLRKTEPHENRWGNVWVKEMSNYIGKTLKVLAINSLSGLISLKCNDIGYKFPYFVLEKVEEPKPQYVPFESVHEFISAYYKANNEIIVSTESMLSGFGMWLRCKENFESNDKPFLACVSEIYDDCITVGKYPDPITFKGILEYCEFLDGSPCGKESKDE